MCVCVCVTRYFEIAVISFNKQSQQKREKRKKRKSGEDIGVPTSGRMARKSTAHTGTFELDTRLGINTSFEKKERAPISFFVFLSEEEEKQETNQIITTLKRKS